MKKSLMKYSLLLCAISIFGLTQVKSQNAIYNNGVEIPVTTAVPFLSITPDARSAGMGDVGTAISTDANAIFHNPSKLAFAEKPLGFAVSYSPWLRTLVKDIYLTQLAAYYKIKLQTVGISLRYFSLGQITFTDINQVETGSKRPNEFALDATYARQLATGFAAGLSIRFIYSDLASGQLAPSGGGAVIEPGMAGAADLSFTYKRDFKIKKYKTNLALGLNLSNIGSKITYTESSQKDFIPMNMGFGVAYEFNFDDYNKITAAIDMDKLLVPTPTREDADNNGVYDYREKSVPAGLFGSFSDAPGGSKEEFHEITWGMGLEYWYNNLFSVRTGYFYENKNKGNRQFFTAGLGVRYSVFGLDFSYLIPTSNERNPLDNTLRFTLLFNFKEVKGKKEAVPTTSSL